MATVKEFGAIFKGLLILYPRFKVKLDRVELQAMTEAYYRILGDLPAELLNAAVLEIGRENTFFPSAAELRKAAMALVERVNGTPSPSDAWAEVSRSFGSHGYYRGAPEWSNELIGKAVDGIGGYAALCTSENPTADRARFIEAYNSYLRRSRDDKAMLPEVRRMIDLMAGGQHPLIGEGELQ